MDSVTVVGICLVIVLVIGIVILNRNMESFDSPSPSMSYSVCRNKGFTKEHCASRFVPGVGETDSGLVGKVVRGSQGQFVVV